MNIDIMSYYSNRHLTFVPPHFVKTSTPSSPESFFWVKSKLTGRFAVYSSTSNDETMIFDLRTYIYFEDPKEAVLYELRWSGS